nr:hypothetical protein [Paracoccus sp. Z118]
MPLGELAFGRSGAECAAPVRAAKARACQSRRPLVLDDLRAALGPDHQTLPPSLRRRLAIHEAGHAVVVAALDLGRVLGMRLTPEGGETLIRWHEPEPTLAGVERLCLGHLAGRAAELLVLGDMSAGGGGGMESDLARATQILLTMELQAGLGDYGHLSIGAEPHPGMILSLPHAVREQLQHRLDRTVSTAQELLGRHRPLLDSLAAALEAAGFLGEAEISARLADVGLLGGSETDPGQADAKDAHHAQCRMTPMLGLSPAPEIGPRGM